MLKNSRHLLDTRDIYTTWVVSFFVSALSLNVYLIIWKLAL